MAEVKQFIDIVEPDGFEGDFKITKNWPKGRSTANDIDGDWWSQTEGGRVRKATKEEIDNAINLNKK